MRRDPATTAQPEAGPNTRSAAARVNDDFINLGEIIAVLLEYKWLILAIGTFAVLVGGVVAFVSTPIYRADALVQVEDKKSAKGGLAALRDVEPEFDSSKAHFRPTPSNGAGFRAMGRQKPRYTGC